MTLPVAPPLLPMLSKRLDALPAGEHWIFEPKWDGFRALVFRDGDKLQIQSRDEKPLLRYFPDLEAPLKANLPERCVVDGEIVIARNNGLDFEALQLRLHPAASRVKMLAAENPSSIVLWDLLCIGDEDLRNTPFLQRRARLEEALKDAKPPVHVTPATRDRKVADDWFHRFEGAGLDGVMAKDERGVYESNKRTMFKVKHERECDAVVAGFRWHRQGGKLLEGKAIGSLLLGLYDREGALQHVGVCGSFSTEKRAELVNVLAPYREGALEAHPWKDWASLDDDHMPGMHSRWNRGKSMAWEPLRLELVAQVSYDHMQGRRFRHTAHFRRWRPDKPIRECSFEQLDETPAAEIEDIFRKK